MMGSLVFKHDIVTMYKEYSEKNKDAMPGMPLGNTLLYSIAKKQQEVRSRRHVQEWTTSRFVIVDKIINVLATLSDLDHTPT